MNKRRSSSWWNYFAWAWGWAWGSGLIVYCLITKLRFVPFVCGILSIAMGFLGYSIDKKTARLDKKIEEAEKELKEAIESRNKLLVAYLEELKKKGG